MANSNGRHLATLGMFIIDEFEYLDEDGNETGETRPAQIGGGGTYAAIGARIWLPATEIGMIIDRGNDFPVEVLDNLHCFGSDMWLFRDNPGRQTTRALNLYRGEHRSFKYLTPRVRLTPNDMRNNKLARPTNLHFICSPKRAASIVSEIKADTGWSPVTIYEPIPDRCVPEELPALTHILPEIAVLSPNAEEALSLLSFPQPPTKALIEQACVRFLELGVGQDGQGHVIIRSGSLGAYVADRAHGGLWVSAYFAEADTDKVVDVTGAGNSFLGGLSAGLYLMNGDVFAAVFYATVSASFTVEQLGLPRLTSVCQPGYGQEEWNADSPQRRLSDLHARHTWQQ